MNAKQMRLLLQSISADPQMKQSKESILLAEDQYPDSLDAILTRLSVPITIQNSITLLQWQRNACDSSYDSALKSTSNTNQDNLRKTYQLIPTSDHPWDNNIFRKRKYFCQSYTQKLQYQQAQHKTLGKRKQTDGRQIVREGGKSARLSSIFLLPNLLIIIGS